MRSRISKWGNSLAVRIPKHIGAEIELAEGTEIELSVHNGSIIITPVSSNYHLEDLVQGITAENRHTETDWGTPEGAEVW
jgi:antitoxin MazE